MSNTTTSTGLSVKKADKKQYKKWMSNSDIDSAITSTRPSSDTLAVIRRLEAEGVIEKDEFTQFSMRFQLPSSDYPVFSDAELLELAASLDSQPQPSAQPTEEGSANSIEIRGESISSGEEGLDIMNQSNISHARINESLGGERSPNVDDVFTKVTNVTNGTGNNALGMAPNVPISAQNETPNIPPRLENVVMKREPSTPPRDVTPTELDFFLTPISPQQEEAVRVGGSSSSTALEPQAPTSNITQQQGQMQPFQQTMERPPRTGIVVRAACFYPPGQSRTGTGTQVGQPTQNGNNFLVPAAAGGSAPTRVTFNFPFSSSVGNMGFPPVNAPIIRTVGDILQQGMQVPVSHFGGGMSVANGMTIMTPGSRPNQIPMIRTQISHPQIVAVSNPINLANFTPNGTARQLQIAGSNQVPFHTSIPASKQQRRLQLSPYITEPQARERVREIGRVAAQREIFHFAALINARKPVEGSAFTRLNPVHGQQTGVHNIRPIVSSQVGQPHQHIVRRAHMRGNQAQEPQPDLNNNASGSGTVALLRRGIIGRPT